MSESLPSKVFLFNHSDPEMQKALENAQSTFRYFWRELSWENRRIIPALGVASVKAPFSDPEPETATTDSPSVEHMWLSDIDFDGHSVSGVLLNAPNWLKSVKEGDSVRIPFHQIGDWMYTLRGEVYGAYTVNLMRSRMGDKERQQHDNAWGLKFGDPKQIRIVPEPKKPGLLKTLFGSKPPADILDLEHPMSEAMAVSLKEQITKDPSLLSAKDDRGWTFLHQEALAGNLATVTVLLEAGADPAAVTGHGMTALQLAKTLRWEKVIALLERYQGKK